MADDESRALPLHAMVGNLWVPAWTVRPGAYAALHDVASALPLWLALHSRNGDDWRPCYHSREELGATLCISRATVSRQLSLLRSKALLLEVERGTDGRSQRHRPPARWALDPFTADTWREEVERSLARVAEEDGHTQSWYERAVVDLDCFERRSRSLAAAIAADMPFLPRKRRKRRPKKRREPKRRRDSS